MKCITIFALALAAAGCSEADRQQQRAESETPDQVQARIAHSAWQHNKDKAAFEERMKAKGYVAVMWADGEHYCPSAEGDPALCESF